MCSQSVSRSLVNSTKSPKLDLKVNRLVFISEIQPISFHICNLVCYSDLFIGILLRSMESRFGILDPQSQL